ncbi:CoA transferase [Frankia sp. QA3]|uniref:CoA transferase n=1 Tax=Frankia sp. QA3 TaxID=710111 RepID=UPI000269B64C|nr:CoA transferase [Frankia sp. QA3]EIV90771.1 putative acyl-CoA transferase/carnitine dehydratase [Frankia sp. QA3]
MVADSPKQQDAGRGVPDPAPLGGLTVLDLSTSMAGAWATQFLADAGADVIQIEPAGGSPLRRQAAWPSLARGRRSIALDRTDADRAVLHDLIRGADVLVSTLRPRAAAALGLAPADLAALNPRLVSAAVTGYGTTGPWAHDKGYEGLVMARLGMFHIKERTVLRPGPAFPSVPFASWGAAQTALHGILAALVERESSGVGQHVEADLVRGVMTIDTWDWFAQLIGLRWPDAYPTTLAFSPDLEPLGPLIFPLLIAPTSDGYWLQFTQVEPRLFGGMMQELGLAGMFTDPTWKGLPVLDSQELRTELWESMICKVGERSLAEWKEVFAANPNIMAEVFNAGPDALDHGQLRHDGRVVVLDDPRLGPVRQPSTLVHVEGRPLSAPRPAPDLDEHGAQIRAALAGDAPAAAGRGPAPTGDVAPTQLPWPGSPSWSSASCTRRRTGRRR